MKRIALVGSAPSSLLLAPFNDPSWEIWPCSPGAYPHVKRVDRWFELHRREPGKPWFTNEYIAFMASLKCPVMVAEPWPELPTAEILPKEALLRQFGPYYFKSSLVWMMAMAVMAGATEIGLWGVDMAAKEEWEWQRSTLQCFAWRIQEAPYNCSLTFPPESDLWMPGYLYGVQEVDPHHIKLLTRRAELQGRKADVMQRMQAAQREFDFLQGAEDDNEYHIKTWVCDPVAREMAIKGPTRVLSPQPDPVLAVDPPSIGVPAASITIDELTAAMTPGTIPNGHLPEAHRTAE